MKKKQITKHKKVLRLKHLETMPKVTKITWSPGKTPQVITHFERRPILKSSKRNFSNDDALELGDDEYDNPIVAMINSVCDDSTTEPLSIPLATREQKAYIDKLCVEKNKEFPPFDMLNTIQARNLTYYLLNDKEWPYGDRVFTEELPTDSQIETIKKLCLQRGLAFPNYMKSGRVKTYAQFGDNMDSKKYSLKRFTKDVSCLNRVHAMSERDNLAAWDYGAMFTPRSSKEFWGVKKLRKVTSEKVRKYLLSRNCAKRLEISSKDALACDTACAIFSHKHISLIDLNDTKSIETIVTRYNKMNKAKIMKERRDFYCRGRKEMLWAPIDELSEDAISKDKWTVNDFTRAGLAVKFGKGMAEFFKCKPFGKSTVKLKVRTWYEKCMGKRPCTYHVSLQVERYYELVRKVAKIKV